MKCRFKSLSWEMEKKLVACTAAAGAAQAQRFPIEKQRPGCAGAAPPCAVGNTHFTTIRGQSTLVNK